MRWVLIVIGVLIGAMGALWTLQGVGLVGGSFMTGQKIWAIIGPIVVIIAIVIVRAGIRRR